MKKKKQFKSPCSRCEKYKICKEICPRLEKKLPSMDEGKLPVLEPLEVRTKLDNLFWKSVKNEYYKKHS